jgi:ribosome recycling factor
MTSINEITKNAESHMHKGIEAFKGELAKLRTGRAHPSLIEGLEVESYGGSKQNLKSLASISVSDARTLTVSPWDKNMVKPIEKAILNADLGLNPVSDGNVLRIPLPALTEERRKDLVKVVKSTAEHSRVAIRNMRRDANEKLKGLLKQKTVSEDEERKAQENVQKLTDKFIAEVDKLAAEKEKDLMTV